MARADAGTGDDEPREIRLVENPDGQWTARDLQAEVSAQGSTRSAALENLDAVVDTVVGDGGHEPTDSELRDLGVDPETARTQDDDLPDVLQ
ncbi:type II toxin-antitoxin system HicB family antitoxin [Halosimplex aquaticum]|uniref:Type II toxin-antitoxin system HicB family antitoxin n=1 Tax=Halosimplex aquaticum TaxID=3026162 RepID=A0ABD5Y4S6_9EURY|nr:type II toxin-antitoxin system HicB family antitoxin [Halosimplex aquaticum]